MPDSDGTHPLPGKQFLGECGVFPVRWGFEERDKQIGACARSEHSDKPGTGCHQLSRRPKCPYQVASPAASPKVCPAG